MKALDAVVVLLLLVPGFAANGCGGTDRGAPACPGPTVCTVSCPIGGHVVTTMVDGCPVTECCALDPDACPPSDGCTGSCLPGRHNTVTVIDGCTVDVCCVPDPDAGDAINGDAVDTGAWTHVVPAVAPIGRERHAMATRFATGSGPA